MITSHKLLQESNLTVWQPRRAPITFRKSNLTNAVLWWVIREANSVPLHFTRACYSPYTCGHAAFCHWKL